MPGGPCSVGASRRAWWRALPRAQCIRTRVRAPRCTTRCTDGGPAITFRSEREKFHEPEPEMNRDYFPILMLIGFVVINGVALIGLSHLVIRRRPTPIKQVAYESGMPPLGDARERFSVKFYLVAMLFIVFDIETVFMIPWGTYYRDLSCTTALVNGVCPPGHISGFGLSEMVVFIVILLVGLVYVWKKGALQWD
jgi:NADH-quinone oxidoreductase subunit A